MPPKKKKKKKAPVHAGTKITVTWVNGGEEGHAVLHIGWRPKDGSDAPKGKTLKAAPGMSAVHNVNVPEDADALTLDYELPGNDEDEATFRIQEGTTAIASETVTEDGYWETLVVE